MKTVQAEGTDTNCFVSLVVDTKGTYVACVTRKMQQKSEVVIKSLGTSYEFFGEGAITTDEDPMTERTEIVDEEVIEYFSLDVEIEKVTNSLEYLDKRFEEIEKLKEEQRKATYRVPLSSNYSKYTDAVKVKSEPKELSLWEEDPYTFDNWDNWGSDYDLDKQKVSDVYVPDSAIIRAAIAKMLTCSLVLDVKKFDLKQWVMRNMKKVYDKMFINETAFNTWKDFAVDFFLDNFNDPKCPGDMPVEEYYAYIASSMIHELEPYKDVNEYIPKYCKALEFYL